MTLKVVLEDGAGTGKKVTLASAMKDPSVNGLFVKTERYAELTPSTTQFSNSNYGTAMNQDATLSGSSKSVHDGVDSVLWTASSIQGNDFTFNSTDRPFAGSRSIRVNSPDESDEMQFLTSSLFTVSNFAALTLKINVNRRWTTDSVSIFGWDTSQGAIVGNKVLLENYFEQQDNDTWHTITIPLVDMGLNGDEEIDALRILQESNTGTGPEYYLDDIKFEGSSQSSPIKYSIAPNVGQILHIKKIQLHLASNQVSGTLANASMPAISYDKFMGLTKLANGVVYQRTVDDVVAFAASIRSLSDFFVGGFHVSNLVSDGTKSFLTLEFVFVEPSILDYRVGDKIEIVINDDLSNLDIFRASAFGSAEIA